MNTIKKPTRDLNPGDKVVWGDGGTCDVDVVLEVENHGETSFKVHVRRLQGRAFFYAGINSVQNVMEEA